MTGTIEMTNGAAPAPQDERADRLQVAVAAAQEVHTVSRTSSRT
jgi:hypothetical protein